MSSRSAAPRDATAGSDRALPGLRPNAVGFVGGLVIAFFSRPRLFAGRGARTARGGGGRPGSGGPPRLVRPHAARGERLCRAQPRRPRLRSDLHVGHPGHGPHPRLARGLGGVRDRSARDRIAGRGREPLLAALPGPRGRRRGGRHRSRGRLHRRHDRAVRVRDRGLRARPAGDARRPGRRARAARDRCADTGARRRETGGLAGAERRVALAVRRRRFGGARGRRPDRRLPLLGLGERAQPQRGDERRRAPPAAPEPRRRRSCSPLTWS